MWSAFVFFKQKTAYEVRISDWSSDVCSSDLWLVEVRLAGQQGVSGVARNHLPHAFYSGARRIEKGVTGALATYTGHASLAPPYAKDRQSWQDRRRGLDQRTSRFSARPRGSRALGRRLAIWQQ